VVPVDDYVAESQIKREFHSLFAWQNTLCKGSFFKYKIFGAVVSILLGLFIIFNPFKIVKIITFTLGIYLIVISILKLFTTFNLKKYGYDGWLVMLVTSFVLLIFGVFIAVNPMAAMDLVQVAAIFIILSSILEICNLIMIYSKAKDIVKLFKEEK